MSYNLVDPTTGDLTRVAGGIDTSIIPSDASASNKLVTTSNMAYLLKDKMSCYTWDTNKTLRAVFYEVTDRDIMPDVNDTVGRRVIARYGNVLINRITQLNGIKNFYWDNTLVLSCPFNDDITKLTDVLEIFVGTTSWQELATTDSTLKTIQLSGTVDCNTLTEPGLYTASAGAVSALTGAPSDIGSAVQLDGGFSILVTKTNTDVVYYGMQMFIPYGSDLPFIRKSYYLNGQYWTPWEQLATESMLPEFKTLTTGNADELRSFANDKLYSLKVHKAFNVADDGGASYQIPMYAEAIFYKHSGDITVQFHSYYGSTPGIWEIFYNSNGQTRGKKII